MPGTYTDPNTGQTVYLPGNKRPNPYMLQPWVRPSTSQIPYTRYFGPQGNNPVLPEQPQRTERMADSQRWMLGFYGITTGQDGAFRGNDGGVRLASDNEITLRPTSTGRITHEGVIDLQPTVNSVNSQIKKVVSWINSLQLDIRCNEDGTISGEITGPDFDA